MVGYGANPTPHQAAASAAGSALSLAEDRKTDRQQRDADENAKNGVTGHHVPNIADNGLDGAHIAKDAGYSGSGGSLRHALLSKKSWLRGEDSNSEKRIFRNKLH